MAMYPIFSEAHCLLHDKWPQVRVTISPGQQWTEFEEISGIVVLEPGRPPVRHYMDGPRYVTEQITVH